MAEPLHVIRWETPPPPARGRGNGRTGSRSQYSAIADQLRARRGEWAVVEEKALPPRINSGLATRICMGHMRCFGPPGDFQAVVRRKDGMSRVYARYLGDGADHV